MDFSYEYSIARKSFFDNPMMSMEDQKLSKPSVICLTETWLSDDSTLSLFEIPEYHRLISHAGFNRNSGAVFMYKNRFAIKLLNFARAYLQLQ